MYVVGLHVCNPPSCALPDRLGRGDDVLSVFIADFFTEAVSQALAVQRVTGQANTPHGELLVPRAKENCSEAKQTRKNNTMRGRECTFSNHRVHHDWATLCLCAWWRHKYRCTCSCTPAHTHKRRKTPRSLSSSPMSVSSFIVL